MLSLKNLTPNKLQSTQEQTSRIIMKTREVEINIEVDTTTEEIVIDGIVAEDMEVAIEEI